ncbi:MAG: aspartyl protease family protein [Fimbriiglobus sp.]
MRTPVAVVVCAGLAWAGPVACAQAPPSQTVPFTLLPSRHMAIAATVNGKGPYTFIFDTGAPLNIVSTAVAKDAGLAKPGLGGGLGLLLTGPTQAKIGTLKVGEVAAEKVPAIVMDHPTVGTISDAFQKDVGPIHGIIGFPFFARYAMTVDYERKQLTLTPNGYKPGDYMDDVFDRLTTAADAGTDPKVVPPAGLWGLTVENPAGDGAAGVVLKTVSDGGPAAKAGLRPGDRVLTIDGRWTDAPADVVIAVSLAKPGNPVTVTLTRGRADRIVTVRPANGL